MSLIKTVKEKIAEGASLKDIKHIIKRQRDGKVCKGWFRWVEELILKKMFNDGKTVAEVLAYATETNSFELNWTEKRATRLQHWAAKDKVKDEKRAAKVKAKTEKKAGKELKAAEKAKAKAEKKAAKEAKKAEKSAAKTEKKAKKEKKAEEAPAAPEVKKEKVKKVKVAAPVEAPAVAAPATTPAAPAA